MKKPYSQKIESGADALACRMLLGMNQSNFWRRVGTTQSGGSRYESGRDIPAAVKKLLNMSYGPDIAAVDEFTDLRDWQAQS